MKHFFCVLAAVLLFSCAAPKDPMQIEEGPFEPSWESLMETNQFPEWFRDAKLGLWAHWGIQCVPEWGDWYARNMYLQGNGTYEHHVATYGHPSEYGFMEFIPQWKAEKFDPDALVHLYKEVGAKYFVAMANHHDNFDNYDSSYQPWNSVNMGPHRDIVGEFARAARKEGLKFGVSNHSSHAWHWFQPAFGYDAEGEKAGVRYDAYGLTKEDGKGTWWEGYDPQQFYGKPYYVMPEGMESVADMNRWHNDHDRVWAEDVPEGLEDFSVNWFLRTKELIDKYDPDLLYLDDEHEIPMGDLGLKMAAHYYNRSANRNDGLNQVVLTAKRLTPERQKGVLFDCERGSIADINPVPWQTCLCIGNWHYDRRLYDRNAYRSATSIIKAFVDIISKNGNLLLNIPVRADGSIDELEVKFLEEFGAWIKINAEGIYGTRPWKIFGEGQAKVSDDGGFGERERQMFSLSDQDVRFTTKGGVLYAFVMGVPADRTVRIRALGSASEFVEGREVSDVRMLGALSPITWAQHRDYLEISIPEDELGAGSSSGIDPDKAVCFAIGGLL